MAGALTPRPWASSDLQALAILKQRGLEVSGWHWPAQALSDDYLVSLWDEAERLGVRRQVEYHGILSKSEALLLQQKADIGLVTYLPLQYCVNSLPNKLMECMSLGLPVVCSDFPNYREIAEKTGAGIMVDPTKPEQIADAIESLVRNPALARQMGEAGKRAVRERFNWNVERVKLLQLYHEILSPPDRKGSSKPKPFEEVAHQPSL